MKKKIVSILIAGILVLSSVRYPPFGVEQAFALEIEDAGFKDLKEEAEEPQESVESSEDSYIEEPDYVKIAGFGELPEDVAYQEVKAGTTLDEIIFPDTLRIDVVPDTDREERLIRKLGEERAARERDRAEDEAEVAGAARSSAEEEEAEEEHSSSADTE